jgi:hypothetical protein
MLNPPITQSTVVCEALLRGEIDYNETKNCLPSETAVARRLLTYRMTLAPAYGELERKLQAFPRALSHFFTAVLQTAAHWSPEKLQKARAQRDQLKEINVRIGSLARDLAELLDERHDLENTSGFGTNTLYHPERLIAAAATGNGHFQSYLSEPLEQLACQYDLKYWPTLGSLCTALADDAEAAQVESSDPPTIAGTEGQRASLSDFVKALFAQVDENRAAEHGPIPDSFSLSDESWASLVCAALDLQADKIIGADYIKGVRQRLRRLKTNSSPLT